MHQTDNIKHDMKTSVKDILFGQSVSLMPGIDDIFELELAFLEYNTLKEDILQRTAYIKSIDGTCSKHYLAYGNEPSETSVSNPDDGVSNFSSAYATHGLFPYRGKFHPQMIKALLNICNIRPGDKVLDPMAGSGTTNIEAALLGFDSYAVDVSPFCQFMIQTKYEALTIKQDLLDYLPQKAPELFDYYLAGDVFKKISKISDIEKKKVYYLGFLAFLDALGYSKRVTRSNHNQLYVKVAQKYYDSVKRFISNKYAMPDKLGQLNVLSESNALALDLPDNSIDCVITSPPYSFAIDYAENDRSQLELLGYNPDELKKNLIGLKGKTKQDKLEEYFKDMDKVSLEVSRVLKNDKYFIMIIGSNTNQTGGIRLEKTIIGFANDHDMPLIRALRKPIRGFRNTMKDEYILIFQKR